MLKKCKQMLRRSISLLLAASLMYSSAGVDINSQAVAATNEENVNSSNSNLQSTTGGSINLMASTQALTSLPDGFTALNPGTELSPAGKDPVWDNNAGVYTITTERGFGDVFYVDNAVNYSPATDRLTFSAEIKATEVAGIVIGNQGAYNNKSYLTMLRLGRVRTMALPWTGDHQVVPMTFDLNQWTELKVEVYQQQITVFVNGVEAVSYTQNFDFSGSIGLMHGFGTSQFRNVKYKIVGKTDAEYAQDVYNLVLKDTIAPSSILENGAVKNNLLLNAVQIPAGNGSTITWASSNTNLIANDGTVTIISEANGNVSEDPNVTMTATITKGSTTLTKTIDLVVFKEADPTEPVFVDMTNFTAATTGTGSPVWTNNNGVYRITGHFAGDSLYLDKTFQYDADNYQLEFKTRIKTDGPAGLVIGSGQVPKNKLYFIQIHGGQKKYRVGRLPWAGRFDREITGINWNSGAFQDLRITVIDGELTVYINDKKIDSITPANFNLNGYIGLYHNAGTSEFTAPQYKLTPITDEEKVQSVANDLTKSGLVPSGSYNSFNRLVGNINIQSYTAANGSTVSFSSSNTNIISNAGVVTTITAANNNLSEDHKVTITATVTKGDATATRNFRFKVHKESPTVEGRVSDDVDLDSYDLIGDDVEATIHNLELPTLGAEGSTYTWSSSNTDVITNAGHIFRPRFDEGDQTATLTVTATQGSVTRSRNIQVTVKADEAFKDPGRMADEDFFGEYTNGSWATESVLNYSITGLAAVKSAVMANDYDLAKRELVKYMKANPLPDHYFAGNARDKVWADSIIVGLSNLQGKNYFAGAGKSTNTTDQFQPVEVDIYPSIINKGGKSSVSIEGKFNETSKLIVASKEAGSALAPKMVLTVNGEERTYVAEADMLVNSQDPNRNYGSATEMPVYLFGKTVNADNKKAKIRFNFADLFYTDEITSAKLVLQAKVTPAFAGEKHFIVAKEASNTWNESTDKWNSFTGYVFNFNGIEGGNTWGTFGGADAEYEWQVPRFLTWDALAAEFEATNDEKYAYFAIQQMMDFIKDKPATFPRSLDVAERLQFWTRAMKPLMDSEYMNDESLTAILKSYYQMFAYLPTTNTKINWKHNELDRMFRAIYSFPIFKDQASWSNTCVRELQKIAVDNILSEGSYIEATGAYNWAAYELFYDFKKITVAKNISLSSEFDDKLKKGAYYALLLRYPDARWLQYGDCVAVQNALTEQFPLLFDWYGDDVLRYIDSFGAKGTKPDWTSFKFEDSKSVMLRSDWTTDALYSFSQVRGGGHHSHNDDNLLLAYAYGRPLLIDPGIFTYTGTDPNRRWGVSTIAHNTVEINGITQNNRNRDNPRVGAIEAWNENRAFTFSTLKSISYRDYYHRRNTTLNKAGFWIVSDYMTPYGSKTNYASTYKQAWHMLPNANLAIDNTNKTIKSNFSQGANVILANSDRGATITTREANGLYDYNYQVLAEAKYAYFEVSNKVGSTSIDTLIFPTPAGQATATSERVNIGVNSSVATAMKFSYTLDKVKTNGYYMLDFQPNLATERNLTKYATNAKMFTVLETEAGAVKQVSVVKGTKVKDQAGNLLLNASNELSDLAYTIDGTTLDIDTSLAKSALVGNISMYIPGNITAVNVNGVSAQFTKTGNIVTLN